MNYRHFVKKIVIIKIMSKIEQKFVILTLTPLPTIPNSICAMISEYVVNISEYIMSKISEYIKECRE